MPTDERIELRVHCHRSGEGGIFANAYLVETANGVVAVDALLTRNESRALRADVAALEKPLLAVLVTHAHGDHIAGLAELVPDESVPIFALQSVVDEMRATEAAKHAQWGSVFGDEWIRPWTYPNHIVRDGEVLTFDGVSYRVHDLGPGGDSPANALWVMAGGATGNGTPQAVAFVGDLVFNGTHAYMADGYILAWLANLERFRPLLSQVATLYPGHGEPGTASLLDGQRDYLLAYCAAVRDLSGGAALLTEEGKQQLVARMEQVRPGAPLGFMIALSADAVAAELAGHHTDGDSSKGPCRGERAT